MNTTLSGGGYVAVTDPESGSTYLAPEYDPDCAKCNPPENEVPAEHVHHQPGDTYIGSDGRRYTVQSDGTSLLTIAGYNAEYARTAVYTWLS